MRGKSRLARNHILEIDKRGQCELWFVEAMHGWPVIFLGLIIVISLMPMTRFALVFGARTISVPTDFPKIQDAINNAADGDTVFVYFGTYAENVVVNRTISLIGQDKSATFIDGSGVAAVVKVLVDNVSISGFTIENGSYSQGGAGILLSRIHYASVTDNVIASSYVGVNLVNSSLNNVENNQVSSCNMSICLNYSDNDVIRGNILGNAMVAGIFLDGSFNNTVEANNVNGGGVYGVYLKDSPGNMLLGNGIVGSENGVFLNYSGGALLATNNIASNEFNFGVNGSTLDDFMQDIDVSNKVDGRSIYYLVNSGGVSLSGSVAADVGYLAIVNSSNVDATGLSLHANVNGFVCAYSTDCILENSSVTSNGEAALVQYSSRCSVANDIFVGNLEGVGFVSSTNGSIRNCSIVNGAGYGLRLESCKSFSIEESRVGMNVEGTSIHFSSDCNVSGNTFVASGFGVLVASSTSIRVSGNVVLNNTGDGVYFASGGSCLVQGNNVTNNFGYGVALQAVQDCNVSGNYVSNNNRTGIFLYSCYGAQVGSDVVKNNDGGIGLQSCVNSTLNGNEVVNNAREGMRLLDSPSCSVLLNVVLNNGGEGIIFENSGRSLLDRNLVQGNAHYGVSVQGSPNVIVSGSNISSNGWDGIFMSESDICRVQNDTMNTNGGAGCRLYLSNMVTIAQNNMTGNVEGLRVFVSNGNTVGDNNVMGNSQFGINMFNATGNKIYHNNLIDNSQSVRILSSSGNIWDDGYPSGGNYWSDYRGVDLYWGPNQDRAGSDGIGDTPYVLDADNKDFYPLMTRSRFHDVALGGIALPSNEVYQGWICPVNVTVSDGGGYVENVSVTAYCSGSAIGTLTAYNLTVGSSVTLTLSWNTSSLQPCHTYNVKADVGAVPGETHVEDNVYEFGSVKVKMVGDVNGDGKVNILDIAAIATGFGFKLGGSRYRLNYDMNLDYVINIVDLSMAAKNFGATCK
jgi:parallel beta-helix repeat protein